MLILKTKSRGMSRVENNFNVNLKDHKQKKYFENRYFKLKYTKFY